MESFSHTRNLQIKNGQLNTHCNIELLKGQGNTAIIENSKIDSMSGRNEVNLCVRMNDR